MMEEVLELGVRDILCSCKKCKETFLWEAGEQKFMLQLQEEGKLKPQTLGGKAEVKKPLLCRPCRSFRREAREKKQQDYKTP